MPWVRRSTLRYWQREAETWRRLFEGLARERVEEENDTAYIIATLKRRLRECEERHERGD